MTTPEQSASTAPAKPGCYPLPTRVGATGYPRQDPATLPRAATPPAAPVKAARPERPALLEAGDGNWVLAGGWKMAAVFSPAGTAVELSAPGIDTSAWHTATVPGTVLTTLVDEGVYPEPTYGLNNLAIPETLNRDDYWYRHEFTPPAAWAGRTLTLIFKGINYAAEVYLNGKRLGEIRGAFRRGVFDITGLARLGGPNALLVRISPVPHPGIPHEQSMSAGAGPNGGAACLDGPNFFCTEGWDWIPGIRDRCAGIWQDVVLHVGGAVTIGDVQVKTDLPLPDLSPASLRVTVPLRNRSGARRAVTVRGEIEGAVFQQTVTVEPGVGAEAVFAPAAFPALTVSNPRLWWPNGYGKPELYELRLSLLDEGGGVADTRRVRFGIRTLTYELTAYDSRYETRRYDFTPARAGAERVIDTRHPAMLRLEHLFAPSVAEGQEASPALRAGGDPATAPYLVIKVNGQRIVCKGGNWGLDEALKRVSRERMEPFFRLERDIGLNMIRNWCGQSTGEVFYELADEYGLMVWNDFWLSTDNYNLEPLDLPLFLENAADTIRRFRNHPSIVLWCGRNEGVPPPALNEGLDDLVRELDGTRYYQPISTALNLMWSGPWLYGDPKRFFSELGHGFTTELGLPCAPTADAIRAMMPESEQWPISDTWAYHDWHQTQNGGVQPFMEAMAVQLGAGTDLEDFCRKAQMINYVAHRAMFEGLNARMWNPAIGRLIWMSHPSWPSMCWQLYSSDYEPNGSFFGAKKACEAVHVQCNLDDRKVVVTNATLQPLNAARVEAELYDLRGQRRARQEAKVDAAANGTSTAFVLDERAVAEVPAYFLKLTLQDAGGKLLSDNFYWHAHRDEDFGLLNTLPREPLSGAARLAAAGRGGRVHVEVRNPSSSVLLMVKATLRDPAGRRVLPAFASDGHFALLPGEKRTFTIDVTAVPDGMVLSLDGWNSPRIDIPVQR